MRLAIGLLALVASSAALQRVAVVTGAARGIGKGIAVELGRLGYAVYALGRSADGRAAFTGEPWADGLSVDATAEAVRAAGGRGEAMICDVGDEAQVAAAIERVRGAEGRLDVLCCSAYTTPLRLVQVDRVQRAGPHGRTVCGDEAGAAPLTPALPPAHGSIH